MNFRWKIAQWFELRWWKNYLGDKDKQDYLIWKKNYWQDILLKLDDLIEINPSKSLADFGCGPAGIFIFLSENKITAVDPLIDEYEKQTGLFRKADYPNATFIASTIEEFNIPSATDSKTRQVLITSQISTPSNAQTCQVFETWQVSPLPKYDLVFCMNAINHVQNIEAGFDQLKKACADKGTIILSIDAHNFKLLKYLFRLIPWDILHPHQFELEDYKKFITCGGWQIAKSELLKKEFFFSHYLLVAKKESLFS